MSKLASISTAAEALGVSTSTMHRWETGGGLTPARTESGQRRCELIALHSGARHSAPANRMTVNDV
ncbi:MerR family DNA-binding transcriptional regulator, partial [Acinetobacter baumannii]|nr:MerR family DNA-binding transcriptional regulator [Acinetobacter baumannii]